MSIKSGVLHAIAHPVIDFARLLIVLPLLPLMILLFQILYSGEIDILVNDILVLGRRFDIVKEARINLCLLPPPLPRAAILPLLQKLPPNQALYLRNLAVTQGAEEV